MTYPVFASGDVLNASDMNAVGLWLVKTQTIGSAVSSIAVTSVFSSDYDNYKIIVSGGAGSTSADLRLQLGATTTGYYAGYNRVQYSPLVQSGASDINGANFSSIGTMNTNGLIICCDVISPNLAKNTFVTGGFAENATGGRAYNFSGFLNDTTQYTGFTILVGSGTATGGTIKVYGYRN